MSIFRHEDIEVADEHIEEIKELANSLKGKRAEPTHAKMWDIIYTVRDFVIEKKRKIYGGFALNKLIETVDPKDKFYDDENIE